MVFRVEDTGIGIPNDKLEEIFKPFVRTDTGSKISEGSGYGLSVVKGLVDLMKGEIEVESTLGRGSLFTVKIPVEFELKDEPKKDSQTVDIQDNKENSIDQVPQQHILIIDDDDTLLTVVSNMIGKLGHQVMICRSKNDIDNALSHADSYDYILTDREMGALTGNDILKLFKKADASKPVYLMTARMDYDNEIAKREGFDGFLQKPFNLKNLESIFGRHHEEGSEDDDSEGHNKFSVDFPELSSVLGDDEEAIKNILSIFAHSTADHLVVLNECVEKDDFATAQGLCHKMLPMFIQLQQEKAIPYLSKMNGLARTNGAVDYPEWKEDTVSFMAMVDELLEMLTENYGLES